MFLYWFMIFNQRYMIIKVRNYDILNTRLTFSKFNQKRISFYLISFYFL